MKVVYLISASENSAGGHYYSLKTTVQVLQSKTTPIVISIGKNKSPVLKNSGFEYYHIDESGIVRTIFVLKKILSKFHPQAIHAFDSRVFLYARLASYWLKTPCVLTKCGGANAKHYPVAKQLVLYSIENFEYYSSHPRFQESKIRLIPNRVTLPKQDVSAIEQLFDEIGLGKAVFLRICRIGSGYRKSIEQSIDLVKELNSLGYLVCLVVIGIIEDQSVFEEVSKEKKEYVYFFTESKYTAQASRLIDIADFVIGTGRGFMEAALLDKTMLAPTNNTKYPTLVKKDNLNRVFYFNFSLRYSSNESDAETIDSLKKLLDGNKESIEKAYIQNEAKEFFCADNMGEKYLPLYKNQAGIETVFSADIIKQLAIKIIASRRK
jgi:glycosyltransferase involved in cell wall biosynthesis